MHLERKSHQLEYAGGCIYCLGWVIRPCQACCLDVQSSVICHADHSNHFPFVSVCFLQVWLQQGFQTAL